MSKSRSADHCQFKNYYAALAGSDEHIDQHPETQEDTVEPLSCSSGKGNVRLSDGCKCPIQHYNKEGVSRAIDHIRLFHQECHICTPTVPDPDSILCASCQHLRLRHLILCVPDRDWSYLVFGTVREVMSRGFCSMCRTLTQLLLRYQASAELMGPSKLGPEEPCVLYEGDTLAAREGILYRPGIYRWLHRKEAPIGKFEPLIYINFLDFPAFQASEIKSLMLPEVNDYTPDTPDKIDPDKIDERMFSQETVRNAFPRPAAVTVQSRCDWAVVRKWLSECVDKHKHEDAKVASASVGLGPALLVDVRRFCIVEGQRDYTYAALSYVWGAVDCPLRCTKLNRRDLMRIDALKKHQPPATIMDACEVCVTLNIDYLWVDTLCIIQDDDEFLQQEIDRMGDIYSSALLTIAAVDGLSAESGLCGVSRVRTIPQGSGAFSGLEVIEMLPGYKEHVLNSVWYTRGWTYQEMSLSKRLLLFTNEQLYFRCNRILCHEDPSVGRGGLQRWMVWNKPQNIAFCPGGDRRYGPFLSFSKSVEEYTTRQLSFQSDIFNALSGVIRVLYNTGPRSSIFGLPEADFDKALLWEPSGEYKVRLAGSAFIPTWSWASHQGTVTYSSHHRNFAGAFPEYFVCEHASEGLKRIQPNNKHRDWGRSPLEAMDFNEDHPPDMPCLKYLQLGQLEGCNAWKPNSAQILHGSSPEPTSTQGAQYATEDPLEQFPVSVLEKARMPGRLLFKASTANFFIRDHSDLNDSDWIFKRDSGLVVTTRIAGQQSADGGLHTYGCRGIEKNLKNQSIGAAEPTFTFIALSMSRSPYFDGFEKYVEYQVAHSIISNRNVRRTPTAARQWQPGPKTQLGDIGYVGNRGKNVRYYDRNKKLIEATPLVNVMLIERVDDVARRIGIGQVYLARWKDANPVSEDIVLE